MNKRTKQTNKEITNEEGKYKRRVKETTKTTKEERLKKKRTNKNKRTNKKKFE